MEKHKEINLNLNLQIITYHDPFYGERDIEKGEYWYDPKMNTCADVSDKGGQCTNKRMVNRLVCSYHYYQGHDY